MAVYQSPRIRRLHSDLAALEALRQESTVFQFRIPAATGVGASGAAGQPPQQYLLGFRGNSLARDRGKVVLRDFHEVEVKLGASYPRTMPELRWTTPIYHPNISEIGMVCLGAYGTHWVPSLALDELCVMLWDMARYQNYDIRSPYNREAALWAANQTTFRFPVDARPLRDRRAALGRVEHEPHRHVDAPIGAIPVPDDEPVRLDIDARRHVDLLPPAPPRPPDDVIFLD